MFKNKCLQSLLSLHADLKGKRNIFQAWTFHTRWNPSLENHLSSPIHHIITDWFLSNITSANVQEHGPSAGCHYCCSFARYETIGCDRGRISFESALCHSHPKLLLGGRAWLKGYIIPPYTLKTLCPSFPPTYSGTHQTTDDWMIN